MEQTVWIFGDRSPATSPFAVCVRPTRAKPREIARRDVRRASARSRPAFRDKPSSRRPHLLRAMMSHASALGSSAPLARGLGAAPPRGRATRSRPRGAGVSLASGRTPTASTSRVSPRDPHRVGGVPPRRVRAPLALRRRAATRRRPRAAAASPAPSPAPGDASASGSSDTGETTAIVNTVKAIFGAGGFSLPWAYAQGGTVLVTACLACSCVFGLASLKMLVKAQETLVEAKVVPDRAAVQTYAGLTGAALGPSGDALCMCSTSSRASASPSGTSSSSPTRSSAPRGEAGGVLHREDDRPERAPVGRARLAAIAQGRRPHRAHGHGERHARHDLGHDRRAHLRPAPDGRDPARQRLRLPRFLRHRRVPVLHPLHAVPDSGGHAAARVFRLRREQGALPERASSPSASASTGAFGFGPG